MKESGSPSNYSLVFPAGWISFDLHSPHLVDDLNGLIDRQVGSLKSVPLMTRELRDMLRGQVEAAREAGGIELHLSLMDAGALTVPASLLISVSPSNGPLVGLDGLERALRQARKRRQIDYIDLPVGKALRHREHREMELSLTPSNSLSTARGASGTTSLCLTNYLAIPGRREFLSLCFSSPLIALEEPLTELFETISHTFRWIW